MTRRTKFPSVVLVASTLALAGCGGEEDGGGSSSGGSSGGSSSLPYTNSAILLASFVDSFNAFRSTANNLIKNDARYQLQTAPDGYYRDINGNGSFESGVDVRLEGNPIEDSGIHYAHAAGLTGAGQVIAFSDDGFLTGHEAFSGKSVTTGTLMGAEDHGTFVASIAAGNSANMVGVAPGADVIFGSFDSTFQLAETADAATAAGAVALNNSWGYPALSANTADYNALFSSSSGSNYLRSLRDYAQDGIVVFSVSNDVSLATTGLMSGLPLLEPALEQSWLAVVNAVPDTVNDDVVGAELVSGACLEAAPWCITANGSWTGATSASSSSYVFGTGTSFAAPTVSGALALLAEAFPDLTHQELRIRLLASADNSFDGFVQSGTTELVSGFDHAYSDEFGHGFLDVAAALLPIGQPTATTANGTVLDLQNPIVVSGGASGDAVTRALRNVAIAGKDTLSASFSVDASQLVAYGAASPLVDMADVLNFAPSSNASIGRTSFFGGGRDFAVQWADTAFDVSLYQSNVNGEDRLGFGLSRGFDLGGARLDVGAAFGSDTAGLLSDWSGGTNASISAFDVALSTELTPSSQVSLAVGYAVGQEASGIGATSDVLMNGSALVFSHRHAWKHNDSLNLSLSLPAAVYSGSTSLSLPVTNAIGQTSHQDFKIDLSPAHREVRLALSYERPISQHANWGISLAHAENRGNIGGLRETALVIGLRTRF